MSFKPRRFCVEAATIRERTCCGGRPTPNDDALQLVGRTFSNTPFVVTERGKPQAPVYLVAGLMRRTGSGPAACWAVELIAMPERASPNAGSDATGDTP